VTVAGEKQRAFRYRLDRAIRRCVMRVMNSLTPAARERRAEFRPTEIQKILLVRSLFRMGDSILATPAIVLFRKNFPAARIDFVGPRISKTLFRNLPIDHHYEAARSFPKVCWSYLALLKRIRKAKYDLAVDVSGSSSALGSFIVGFSAARFRVGLKGPWDRWFNIRLVRPSSLNKYAVLPELVRSMGLESPPVYPTLILSSGEIAEAGRRLQALITGHAGPFLGVFVGGRKARGKRWAKENFLELAQRLRAEGTQPIVFIGPEESDLLGYFSDALGPGVPVLLEPDVRAFAALIANCSLFVGCDSGPVHLACALRVSTIAIFLQANFDHWGPPAELGRVVFDPNGVPVDLVLDACRDELRASLSAKVNHVAAFDHVQSSASSSKLRTSSPLAGEFAPMPAPELRRL
jgi:ADP-heptose:LPS heptosyltransferase